MYPIHAWKREQARFSAEHRNRPSVNRADFRRMSKMFPSWKPRWVLNMNKPACCRTGFYSFAASNKHAHTSPKRRRKWSTMQGMVSILKWMMTLLRRGRIIIHSAHLSQRKRMVPHSSPRRTYASAFQAFVLLRPGCPARQAFVLFKDTIE